MEGMSGRGATLPYQNKTCRDLFGIFILTRLLLYVKPDPQIYEA